MRVSINVHPRGSRYTVVRGEYCGRASTEPDDGWITIKCDGVDVSLHDMTPARIGALRDELDRLAAEFTKPSPQQARAAAPSQQVLDDVPA